MNSTLESVILGFLFMAVGALASWLISRAYYVRGTRPFLSIVGSRPWQLMANVEKSTRARIDILVDGELANELTRLRYEFTNYGHVPILLQSPIRFPLSADSVVVEASIPSAGPSGLQLGLEIDYNKSVPILLINAPILNAGDRFSLELLVRDLDNSFAQAFNVQAPGLDHTISPKDFAPYADVSSFTRLVYWVITFMPILLFGYPFIGLIRYAAWFAGWTNLPAVFQLPAEAIRPALGLPTAVIMLVGLMLMQIAVLRTTRNDRRSIPRLATMIDRDDLTVSSLPSKPRKN